MQFYARCHAEMDKASFNQITDCLAWKLHNNQLLNLKGRTINSMIKLAAEWRSEMQTANIRQVIEWPGLQIRLWRLETPKTIWEATELRTNIELLKEGRKQKHCVFTYVPRCVGGKSSIVSMRGSENTPDESSEVARLTIEVTEKRAISQIRGYRNRRPAHEEMTVIRRWAGDKALQMDT